MERVHFIGIGGSGLSAIARLMKESGYEVTGSDRAMSEFAAGLRDAGIQVHIGHDPANVSGSDWVVRSSAVDDTNVEVEAARAAGIPVYRRSEMLGRLLPDKVCIAVAGTHGKTTTTAMIAWMLSELGCAPSYLIGGVSSNFGVNAHAGRGNHFVIEADEYDHMFLGLRPHIEIVSNVEHDHPDRFPAYDDIRLAFEAFVDLLPAAGTLIASITDPGARGLLERVARTGRAVVAFGEGASTWADNRQWIEAHSLARNEHGGFDFAVRSNIGPEAPLRASLHVPGAHNVQNALAGLAVVGVLGLSMKDAAVALETFRGTARRFEIRGQRSDITVIDDYAHHPTEIRATLAAARARYPGRTIWAVWQPHTYSRTRALATDFAAAFSDADHVLVTEIFPSREPIQDYSSAAIVERMRHRSARFTDSLDATAEYLLSNVGPGAVVLVLSAGDADRISKRVLDG